MLLVRLREAGWHDITFSDLAEYDRFRADDLLPGSPAHSSVNQPLLDWYVALQLRYPCVARAARYALTIPLTNTNLSGAQLCCVHRVRDYLCTNVVPRFLSFLLCMSKRPDVHGSRTSGTSAST